ncbi:PLP-dependent aminotransferase family protein [Pseudaquabacterium terrae]|uniref:MocR-like pyridoxine biosynthesis transcription factor PdxR n=1 Tax=Pseudaquabacterium terrae TaxID=2732868 RepID=UPI001FE93188|nr:PLP-dependent aminotransferase family protein [Aquabacterium terrae]
MALDLPAPGSRRRQQALLQQLRAAILSGRLQPGLRLPASRALAAQAGLARQTVVVAYDSLLAEGYLVARPGAGTFVADGAGQGPGPRRALPAERMPVKPAPPRRAAGEATPPPLDFRLGVPDIRAFPHTPWRRLAARTLRELERAPVERGPAAGEPALREAIAQHVSFARAVAARGEQVIVSAGAQQAFHLLARTLVAAGRRVVAVEDPGYPPVREAFAAAGARVLAVPVDGDGLVVERLSGDVRVICVTPSHQFPYGVPMSAARRRALLAFARRHRALVIEDDYDGEFRFDGRALDALKTLDRDGDTVFYVGTFSKSLAPALRLGYVIAPPAWVEPLAAAREAADSHGPVLEQRILAAFIAEGHLARHVRRMQREYAARRRALLTGLAPLAAQLRPLPALAGLHLAAAAAPGLDLAALTGRALAEGIGLHPLGAYALRPDAAPALGFGYGAIDAAGITEALRRLARLL